MRKLISGFLLMVLGPLTMMGQNDTVRDDRASAYNLNRPQRVEWFRNTGAGLFIHFSVDAQLGVVISHSLVGASDDYVDRYFNELPKTFDPARFSPHAIAVLAKLAGMKYIVFTTKHHSGFCLWDTKTSPFNIMHTPYGRDLLKTYTDATRAEGLGVGFYFSPEDFWFLHTHGIPISRTDVVMSDEVRKAYDDYTRAQCEELMTNYGKIDVLFIDGSPKEVVKSTCWRLQPDILITRGAMRTPEQVLPGERDKDPWLSCITMGTAWQYQPTNERYKSGNQLIRLAIEARAKGGSLLLNVGPKPDGELPMDQEDRLREMAAWYFINHESMDSVRSWVVSREGETWFTARGAHTVYAIVTEPWKEGDRKTIRLHSVKAAAGLKVSVLGQNSQIIEYKKDDVNCRYRQDGNALEISAVKAQRIYDDHRWPNPVVIKLEGVDAAFEEGVEVRTLEASTSGGGTGGGQDGTTGRSADASVTMKGQVFGARKSEAKRARFYYRPYAGQVETLYAAPWMSTRWTTIDSNGRFQLKDPKISTGKQYEYRAVVEYHGVEINGDDRIYKPVPAPQHINHTK